MAKLPETVLHSAHTEDAQVHQAERSRSTSKVPVRVYVGHRPLATFDDLTATTRLPLSFAWTATECRVDFRIFVVFGPSFP